MTGEMRRAYFAETDDYDGTGEVVWLTDEQAKTPDEEWYSIKRVPEFDQYEAQGWVPSESWIGWGGWLGCAECGAMVTPELWDYDKDKPLKPVHVKFDVYCCQGCRDKTLARAAETKRHRENLLQEFRAKLPQCDPVVDSFFYRTSSSQIDFTFPGGKGSWRAEDPDYVSIAPIYMQAWEALQG